MCSFNIIYTHTHSHPYYFYSLAFINFIFRHFLQIITITNKKTVRTTKCLNDSAIMLY